MINKLFSSLFAASLCLASVISCNVSSIDEEGPGVVGSSVTFNAISKEHGTEVSKASYRGTNYEEAEKKYEVIDWTIDDLISVGCYQTTPKSCNYKVISATPSEKSSTAVLAPKDPGAGLKWGSDGKHSFYAAHGCSDLSVTSSSATATFTLPQTQLQGEGSGWSGDTFVVSPNKEYFHLVAQSYITKSAGVDQPINLTFLMLPTVVEITLTGEEDMLVKNVALSHTSTTTIAGTYTATLTNIASETFPTSKNYSYTSTSTSVNMDVQNEGQPVLIQKGKALRFTFFLYPKDISGLKFSITTIENHEGRTYEYTRSAPLKSDGATLTLPAHSKTVATGFVVPEGIKWLYVNSINIKEWTDDDAGILGF